MTIFVPFTDALTTKDVDTTDGLAENVKVESSAPEGATRSDPLFELEATKSNDTPVVGPVEFIAKMTHGTPTLIRRGVGAVQTSLERGVGRPNTTDEVEPPDIRAPPTVTLMYITLSIVNGVAEKE